MTLPSFSAWRWAASLAALAALVIGCGGGSVGSGGTGGPVQGYAVGTVNGFGSVIVDGVHYDDRQVPPVMENHLGEWLPVEVRLGHRVRIALEQPGVAESLRVDGALRGPVASVGAGEFVVMGQTVRINADPLDGPVTQFGGGYAGLADMLAGDVVDVHGILDAQGTAIQATRVQREAIEPPFYQATGIVRERSADGATFRLGALTVTAANAIVVPAGRTVGDGQLVKVMAPPEALSGLDFAASRVRIDTPLPAGGRTVTSGAIASVDPAARVFVIGAQRVAYGAATLAPPGLTPQVAQYVRVQGTLDEAGTLVAEVVVLRDGTGEAEAELRGNVAELDVVARTFSVRGVRVDYSLAAPEGCGAGLADGAFVEVEGRLLSVGVEATRVKCESEAPGSVVERRGTASAVSAEARTFTLAIPTGTLTVSWSDATFFRDVSPSSLDGQLVLVEGVLNAAGVLEAGKVRLHPGATPPEAPAATPPETPAQTPPVEPPPAPPVEPPPAPPVGSSGR